MSIKKIAKIFIGWLLICILISAVASNRDPFAQQTNDGIKAQGNVISLRFHNISVRSLLELLAEYKNINMVISDQVKGNITLYLANVSWQQALNTVVTMAGLSVQQKGNIWFIAVANTFLLANSAMLMHLRYAKATDMAALLQNKSNKLLSDQGIVIADVRTNALWIKDTANNLAEIKQLLHSLDIPVKQVQIAARIVNVDESYMRDLGIEFSSNQLNSANTDNLNMNLPNVNQQPNHFSIAIAKLGQGNLLDLELAALESQGHAKIISDPRLITANQQPAHIESGEEIPYQEKTSSGATNIAFKKAVLSLRVTPEITPDNKVTLTLTINQDKLSSLTINGVPAVSTQEVQAQVTVNNNETIVLGGIYQQSQQDRVTRVPFLGSIPIIGRLFRSDHRQTERRELLVFITPHIILAARGYNVY